MGIEKFNKGERKFKYEMPEGAQFTNLKELYEHYGADYVHVLTGMYVSSKGKFGEQPVLLTVNNYVNAPKHLLESVKEILDDSFIIEQINNGNAGFYIKKYIDKKYNKECYGVQFVDLYDSI